MKKIISLILVSFFLLLSGCQIVSKFEITDFELVNRPTIYSEEYMGQGTVETDLKGNYVLMIDYEKEGGDMFKNETILVVVENGEGHFNVYDTILNKELDEEYTEPEYEFNINTAEKFIECSPLDFEVTSFTQEKGEQGNYYKGTGTIKTDFEGKYTVLIKYYKDGGSPDTKIGYTFAGIADGEGEFSTLDLGKGLAKIEEFIEPEYQFQIIGYRKK